MLLLAGGDQDPQILRLMAHATSHHLAVHSLLTGHTGKPRIHWDIKNNIFMDGSHILSPSAAFLHQDVFTFLQSGNETDRAIAREWHVTLAGWLLSNPNIKVFNRKYLAHGPVNKPYILHLAMQLGFSIADSFVSNNSQQMDALVQHDRWIKKPVTGGAHCEPLESSTSDKPGSYSYPQIIQYRLEQPELRIFRIGKDWFAFNVISDALDYRSSSTTTIRPADVPAELIPKMTKLTDLLGLDFAAADFKTDPNTRTLEFLEINTNPMFAGFDQFCDGAICDAILTNLGITS